jgi:hypothetical protein
MLFTRINSLTDSSKERKAQANFHVARERGEDASGIPGSKSGDGRVMFAISLFPCLVGLGFTYGGEASPEEHNLEAIVNERIRNETRHRLQHETHYHHLHSYCLTLSFCVAQ